MAWCVLFYFTIWDKPNENPRISEAELRYLERELGDKGLAKEVSDLSQHPSKSGFQRLSNFSNETGDGQNFPLFVITTFLSHCID